MSLTKKQFSLMTLLLASVVGGIAGGIIGVAAYGTWRDTPSRRIADTYEGEMATFVSPTTVKKMIDANDTSFVLVDLRSRGEYVKEHIKGAVNVPAGSLDESQVVEAFSKLPKDKEIIVHCYSASCTLGRQIGLVLSRHGIFVKEMDVGWNEWRYHWDLWNPGAKPLDGLPYIATGSADPNAPIIPCTVGSFGC